MWELDHKEIQVPKNWHFQIVILEDSWESLGCKEIKPVCPKGNQPWIFIGRTGAEAEAPIIWPPDAKSWLTAGQDWGQEEKGVKEDEMVGWHHWLSGHEFEQTLGDSEKQDSLACCCSPWVTKSWTQLSNGTKTRSIMGTDQTLNTVDGDCSHEIKRCCSLEGKFWQT